MKLIDIIKILQEKYNIKVTFRRRGAGEGRGIRITSINGVKYKGSTGNIVARGLIGASVQHGKKLPPLPDEIRKQLLRVQRIFRKKGIKAGKPTTKNVRYNLEKYGAEEVSRLLTEAERYAKGLAYNENLNALITRLEQDKSIAVAINDTRATSILQEIINKVEQKRESITEEQLVLILATIYDAEQKRRSWGEVLNDINLILTNRFK